MKTLQGRRIGSSLIEMMMTITVLTIMLGMCAGLIRVMLKLDQAGRVAMDTANDQVRLARDWRDEAHRSTSAIPRAIQADHLTLDLPDDETVVYTIRPHDVLRELRKGDKTRLREVYRTPPKASVRFEGAMEAGRSMVSIVIPRTPQSSESEIRVDAEVGRFARLIARKP